MRHRGRGAGFMARARAHTSHLFENLVLWRVLAWARFCTKSQDNDKRQKTTNRPTTAIPPGSSPPIDFESGGTTQSRCLPKLATDVSSPAAALGFGFWPARRKCADVISPTMTRDASLAGCRPFDSRFWLEYFADILCLGRHLSYQRGRHTIHPQTSLIKIEGVDDTAAANFYLGKKVAYVYKGQKEIRGTKIRVIWGKVTRPHGNSGVVRAKFTGPLPSKSFGASVRIMLYPSSI
ncbi:60S ribosomal protein L33-A [Seiridium cupressi]